MKFCFVLSFLLAASVCFAQGPLAPEDIHKLPECSLSKTNNSCKLVINRSNLVAPPAIQMYSNQRITVIVKNPYFFERYFLDYQSGQATLLPDVASGIVQAFTPSLPRVAEFLGVLPGGLPPNPCVDPRITGAGLPAQGNVSGFLPPFRDCVQKLAADATGIYGTLEPYIAPDSRMPTALAQVDPSAIEASITELWQTETTLSVKVSKIATKDDVKSNLPDMPAIAELTSLQKFADAIAADLTSYKQRLTDLSAFDNGTEDCDQYIDIEGEAECVAVTSGTDDDRVYHGMVTRSITYVLNVLNLVSNSQQAVPDQSKKKSLASINLNFADVPVALSRKSLGSTVRWETSAGVFFSNLAVRSFSVSPLFTNGTVTDKVISESILHPTVVPFAAANYRVTNDLGWSRWKSAIYLTAGIGVNPNTVSADFCAGPSVSWRALMFSGLWHYGHDVKLTQGLQPNQSLGASFGGNLPTQTYWRNSFAVGISVRVPALSGR